MNSGMSAIGTWRTLQRGQPMSAFASKTDIVHTRRQDAFDAKRTRLSLYDAWFAPETEVAANEID
jgi:hypothetical protein